MYREITHNGKYRYVQSFKDKGGKSRRVSVVKNNKTRATEKEAYEELQEKINKILNPVQEYQNLGYYKQKYLEFKKPILSDHTYYSYTQHLNNIDDNDSLDNITKVRYDKYFNELRGKLAPGTIQVRVIVFNNFFKFIKKYYVESFDVHTEFKLTKEERAKEIQKIKYLNRDEIPILLEKITDPKVRNVAIVQLNTGLRIGELLALTYKDVDFENKTISITKTKSNTGKISAPKTISSIRTIEVSDVVLNILKDYISWREYLFDVSYSTIRNKLKLLNVTSHMFRHTHVALLIEAGVPIKVISHRLGHSDINTTLSIYTHVTKTMKIDLQTKLESLSLFFPHKIE